MRKGLLLVLLVTALGLVAVSQNLGGQSVSLADRLTNLETAVFGGPNTASPGVALTKFVSVSPSGNQTIVGQTLTDVTGFIGPRQDVIAQVITGDGAITVKTGTVILSKGTAAAITLAAPVAVTDDGKLMRVISTAAAAQVITSAVDGFNAKGSSGTCTFGAAIGNGVLLEAYNGHWYVISSVGNTVA